MKEIKFRGKRVDTGEWIEGYLFKSWNQAFILWGVTNGIPDMLEVDPKTVGQYTGLKDKNGKEIYEGDILQQKSNTAYLDGTPTGKISIINYVVKWDNLLGRWGLWKQGEFVVLGGLKKESLEKWFTVIGNIHKNPELLER